MYNKKCTIIYLIFSKKLEQVNTIKTIILNIVNIFLMIILFFLVVGFCIVWKRYENCLLIIFSISIILDFILGEVVLELLLMLCYYFKKYKFLMKTKNLLLNLKSLRVN